MMTRSALGGELSPHFYMKNGMANEQCWLKGTQYCFGSSGCGFGKLIP